MRTALDENNVLIDADDADYGKYTCPECKSPVGLRKTHQGKPFPHFYHTGSLKDDKCSLSYYEDNWEK
jgi:competence CoiA-like predicted nuclease